jgi:hypothetical protein
MGLEGLVSKRRDRPYQAGRLKHWNQGEEPEASGDGAGDRDVRTLLHPQIFRRLFAPVRNVVERDLGALA